MALVADTYAPFVASWAERSEKTCFAKITFTQGAAASGLAPMACMPKKPALIGVASENGKIVR